MIVQSRKGFAEHRSSPALPCRQMSDGKQQQERADRNQERSEEAHWQVAEAGAEEDDPPQETARPPDEQQGDWENEGGALDSQQD